VIRSAYAILVTGLLVLICSPARAEPYLACFQERRTYVVTCIDENAVTVNGDTRAAPLYSGGSNGVEKLPYLLMTNCAKHISTLRDRNGAYFEGDISSSATAVRLLARWTCEVRKPAIDPTLRQLQDSGKGQ
jgi:hypothetical protein